MVHNNLSHVTLATRSTSWDVWLIVLTVTIYSVLHLSVILDLLWNVVCSIHENILYEGCSC